jgi:xanthine dehydrogenase YagR molybdenum-binding subunit
MARLRWTTLPSMSGALRAAVAEVFGLKPEAVRVRNEFVGGGFGAKGYVWPHPILAALAARVVGRPVKLTLTRAQAFTSHGYQPATEQSITLGAKRDGRLTALRHWSVSPTSLTEEHVELAAVGSRVQYACPAIQTRHRIVRVNTIVPTPMRAPHEGPGMVWLEIAMDELAYALGLDPLELRLRNYAERDPSRGVAFSSKKLRECYLEGAERFGWSRRSPRPESMRDGRDLVGWGMASVLMSTFRMPSAARVTIDQHGDVLIEAGCQEIGNGAYTIMPQIAAEALGGIDPDRVRLHLGDTTLPETGGTFGSSTTLSVGSAVHDAATRLRERLVALAEEQQPLDPARYAHVLEWVGLARLSADGSWSPGAAGEDLSMHSFGAIFVEVRVDADLRIARLSRAVGVYNAGRIINSRTAHSQMTGGIVWGLGQALLEASGVDRHLGRFVSKNLAGSSSRSTPTCLHWRSTSSMISTRTSVQSARAASANWALWAWGPPSRTPSFTRPAFACVSCRFDPNHCCREHAKSLMESTHGFGEALEGRGREWAEFDYCL